MLPNKHIVNFLVSEVKKLVKKYPYLSIAIGWDELLQEDFILEIPAQYYNNLSESFHKEIHALWSQMKEKFGIGVILTQQDTWDKDEDYIYLKEINGEKTSHIKPYKHNVSSNGLKSFKFEIKKEPPKRFIPVHTKEKSKFLSSKTGQLIAA